MPEAIQPNYDPAFENNALLNGVSVMGWLNAAAHSYLDGMSRYTEDFLISYLLSTRYFQRVESERIFQIPPLDNFEAYLSLLDNNIELMDRSLSGTFQMMTAFAKLFVDDFNEAVHESCFELKHDKLVRLTQRQAKLLNQVTQVYPQAISDIEPEFSFHFERGEHVLLDETDRFLLYRVAPSIKGA